MSETNQGKWS